MNVSLQLSMETPQVGVRKSISISSGDTRRSTSSLAAAAASAAAAAAKTEKLREQIWKRLGDRRR